MFEDPQQGLGAPIAERLPRSLIGRVAWIESLNPARGAALHHLFAHPLGD